MDTQRKFQKGDTICALKDIHQEDTKGEDIPDGGEIRNGGKISLKWMGRVRKKISGFRIPRNSNI